MAVVIAGALHPDYSHLANPISALGARGAPYRVILNYAGLIPVGVLTLLFSAAIFRYLRENSLLTLSAWLVVLVGMGRFLAGIFPCDPGCLEFLTVPAKIHAVAGLTALVTGALAPLAMAIGLRKLPRRSYYYISVILGTCAVLTIFLSMTPLWPTGIGAFQRLLLIFTYSWIAMTALNLVKVKN